MLVEMQRLDGVMRLDAVKGRCRADFRRGLCLVGVVAALAKRGGDNLVVLAADMTY